MSRTDISLTAFSDQLVELVRYASSGVVALTAGAYRVASGVVIESNLIATTDHTLKREQGIQVFLQDGSQIKGELAARFPGFDVAFVRVEGRELTPLTAAKEVKAGGLVAVVGFTADVGPSASLGIVGAVGGERKTWRGGRVQQFTRLDVNLYPSQSGAAVVNTQGELIGLATPALLRHSAVAVPISDLRRLAAEVREGRTRQGYLGVGLQPVGIPDKLRESAAVDAQSGLMLLSVEEDSPAARSGLQMGDILVALGDAQTSEPDELQEALRGPAVGQTREALLIRGGSAVRIPIAISERQPVGHKGE